MKKLARTAAISASLLVGLLSCDQRPKVAHDKNVTFAQDTQACAAQPDLPWCSAAPKGSYDPDLAQLIKVEKLARARFTYRPDDVNVWSSSRGDVEAGRDWYDDCDGMTTTVLDMLAHEGVRSGDLGRLILETGEDVKHMVGVVQTADGRRYIVGDVNADAPYPVEDLSMPVLYESNSANGVVWSRD